MNGMFEFNRHFNQNINSWDVSSVEDFSIMFRGASAFDRALCWDVSGKNAGNDDCNNNRARGYAQQWCMFGYFGQASNASPGRLTDDPNSPECRELAWSGYQIPMWNGAHFFDTDGGRYPLSSATNVCKFLGMEKHPDQPDSQPKDSYR